VEGEGGVTEGLCGPGSQGPFGKGHSVQVRDLLDTGHKSKSGPSGEVQSVQIRYFLERTTLYCTGPKLFEERYLLITS
jgi:hypothetical protein